MGKISHLKCNFYEIPGKKVGGFFPAGPFIIVWLVNGYWSALTPRKLPCPKKISCYAPDRGFMSYGTEGLCKK